MSLRVLTPASSELLALRVDIAEELGTAASEDALLDRLLLRASRTIRDAVGYDLIRQEYRETFGGSRLADVVLSRTPIAGTPSVVDLDDPDDPIGAGDAITDFVVADHASGILYRQSGWPKSLALGHGDLTVIERPGMQDSAIPRYRAEYWAGWFRPGEKVLSSAVSFAAADDSINGTGFPAGLQTDDVIQVNGATNASNNGRFRVLTASTTKITVDAALAEESAGASVVIDFRSLPGDIEEAAATLTKALYLSRKRDRNVRSERVGPYSVEYGATAERQQMPGEVLDVISQYRRAA